MAPRSSRIGARTLDLIAEVALVLAVLGLFGDADRPWAGLALVWFAVFVYEAATVAAFGATPGKLVVGLRIVALDRPGSPPPAAAARRAAAQAALAALPIVGWAVWAASVLGDALGRGVADRAAATMVVPRTASLPVATRDLPGFADGARPPRVVAQGRVGDLDVRARARLRRLVDVPVLAGAVGLLALAAAVPTSTLTFVLATSAAWIVVFVIDETRRVHHHGATTGHRQAGLVVVDRRRGEPPSAGRSFARAVVLALTLYVPVLWPVLVISVAMVRWNDTGRGLHDLAGGTLVVADPRLDPEHQRQLAMRMRIGRAV